MSVVLVSQLCGSVSRAGHIIMMGKSQNVDGILLALGSPGKYQMSQLFISLTPMIASAFQLLSNVFTCHQVPHQCSQPSNITEFPSQYHQLNNVSFDFQQCSIVIRSNGDLVGEENCIFGIDYALPRDTSAVSQFDLVCDRESLAKLSQTLVIAGQGVGAVLITIASDRLGRKSVLIGMNLGLLVSGLIVAYSPNYLVFAIFKFVTGAFQQGAITVMYTFGVELFPTDQRRINAMIHGLAWSFGVMLLPFISYLTRALSWRTTSAIYCIASLTVVIKIALLDESLRWLFANGRSVQANEVIRRAATTNRKSVDDVLMANYDDSVNLKEEKTAFDNEVNTPAKKMSLLDLLRVRRLLINALAIWLAWFTSALGFFALYLTSTSLAGNPYLNFFLTACMEAPSNIYFYFCLNRLGRKLTLASLFILMAISLLSLGVLQSLESDPVYDALILVFSLTGMIGASGAFLAVYAYTPEMFPTNVRSQALGMSSFFARCGGMIAPFTSVLAAHAKWGPAVLIGCLASVVCILLKVLPETSGRELPQTVEDLLDWYRKDITKESKAEKDKKDDKNCIL